MNTEDQVQLTSVQRCAELLAVSASTVRRMLRDGRLRSVRVGARVLVPLVELKHLVETPPSPKILPVGPKQG